MCVIWLGCDNVKYYQGTKLLLVDWRILRCSISWVYTMSHAGATNTRPHLQNIDGSYRSTSTKLFHCISKHKAKRKFWLLQRDTPLERVLTAVTHNVNSFGSEAKNPVDNVSKGLKARSLMTHECNNRENVAVGGPGVSSNICDRAAYSYSRKGPDTRSKNDRNK